MGESQSRLPFLLAVLLLIAAAFARPASPQAGQTDTLVAQTVLAGSPLTIGNSCSRLIADLGQPAPGFSSGGNFSLSAGFIDTVPAAGGDTIFFDGGEACHP